MNPAHTSPEPGLAPCGMKLEPVYAEEDGNAPDPHRPPGAVQVNSQKQQLLGVRVAPVEEAPYTYTLRALGKVAVDETRIYRLNAAVDGWIRDTFNNSTGMVVKKDEPLASFYSPEFLTAATVYWSIPWEHWTKIRPRLGKPRHEYCSARETVKQAVEHPAQSRHE